MKAAGQAAIEYLIVCAVCVAVLFGQPDSLLRTLIDAATSWYQQFTFAIGLP